MRRVDSYGRPVAVTSGESAGEPPLGQREIVHALHRRGRAGFMGTVDAAGDNALESPIALTRKNVLDRHPATRGNPARRSPRGSSEPATGAVHSSD
ncbi:hypothetical protein [Streptomyces sp. SudanB182_2057]|uniref:hypothetical protein n=1 Tax=Streptomyces sp. SudanB182_2057 TaxID=3035281 RepID=UPI003F57B22D